MKIMGVYTRGGFKGKGGRPHLPTLEQLADQTSRNNLVS
jgi:hypothetical protein